MDRTYAFSLILEVYRSGSTDTFTSWLACHSGHLHWCQGYVFSSLCGDDGSVDIYSAWSWKSTESAWRLVHLLHGFSFDQPGHFVRFDCRHEFYRACILSWTRQREAQSLPPNCFSCRSTFAQPVLQKLDTFVIAGVVERLSNESRHFYKVRWMKYKEERSYTVELSSKIPLAFFAA